MTASFFKGPFLECVEGRADLVEVLPPFLSSTGSRVPRRRTSATAPFVSAGIEPKDRILAAFDLLQEQMAGCVREADGLDLGRLRIISLFDSRLKYNLYSCLRIILAHQRQHLLQAEHVIRSLRRVGGGG